jgi:CheY-like chemotaxis protein
MTPDAPFLYDVPYPPASLGQLVPLGLWQFDAEGASGPPTLLLDAPACRLLGLPAGEGAVRLDWIALGDAGAPWRHAAQQLQLQGGSFAVEIEVPLAGVHAGTVRLAVHGLGAGTGPSSRVSGVLMAAMALADMPITAAAAASVADLLEVERLDALARLNRELRVPLNAMLGLAQLIEADALAGADDPTVGHSRAILSSGRQMLDMIDELLVLRDAGLAAPRATLMPLDVEETLHRWMLPEATYVATVQPSGAAHVWADPVLMRRLITIAGGREIARVRGTGAGASVSFDASSGSQQVRLNFVHHYRDVRRPDERSALRVELVRRLSQAMGGALRIDDREDGVTFEVSLRRAHPHGEPSEAAVARPGAAATTAAVAAAKALAGSVLCVEDDPSTLLLMRHALAVYPGIRLRTAATVTQALDLIAEEAPDLVLLDLVLPGAGGDEVLRSLRAGARRDATACVVLSSIVDASVRERLMAAGADEFLAKPIRLDTLHATLVRFLTPPAAPVAPARAA